MEGKNEYEFSLAIPKTLTLQEFTKNERFQHHSHLYVPYLSNLSLLTLRKD